MIGGWPIPALPFVGPLDEIPRGRDELVRVFGDPEPKHDAAGVVHVSPKWERANMVKAADLPGYGKAIYCHRLVEPYLREGLLRARAACPEYEVGAIGCFAPRHERHDAKRPLSLHTWGIALDVDSDTNGAKANAKAAPWSPRWLALWPRGLPRPWVEAMRSVGFEWGGAWASFRDPMHFQLLRS